MRYPKQEKIEHDKKIARNLRQQQLEIYLNSESFEKYAVECTVNDINRKWAFFGLVDPFWVYYIAKNTGPLKLKIVASLILMVGLNFIAALVMRFFFNGISSVVTSSIGAVLGVLSVFGVSWFIGHCIALANHLYQLKTKTYAIMEEEDVDI